MKPADGVGAFTDARDLGSKIESGARRTDDGQSLAVLQKANSVHSIAFAPKGSVYAYTEYGGSVTVVDSIFAR